MSRSSAPVCLELFLPVLHSGQRCFEAVIDFFKAVVDLSIYDELYSDLLTSDSIPGKSDPEDGGRNSEEDWRSCTLSGFTAVSHPIGTLDMEKYSLGGVVDSQLKA
ncbi:uncharacterized protein EV420DRAFT_1650149 [Desarmillaria tabescens]|uniref:Uncharacterized protein n=1 Tax=Armillaria tabescens TaxID=1929756 RepID=A0AA39MPQ0_ARMTA|nr:uncharacterized protein EV420DRAFT_1650149 [Desarmillaria tabescens]KAK0441230.1 hypothetical protein EV420DRAFT_1650149 [Desarmillaria tabescens]